MNNGRDRRTPVCLEAMLISGGIHYSGFIANLSEYGVGVYTYVENTSTETAVNCNTGEIFTMKFQIPSGETLCLNCKVKWLHVHKTSTHGLINSMGLEIIDPPLTYKEFSKTLAETYCLF
jgi:hypothetical protein